VNRAYWADRLDDGTPLPDQDTIASNNGVLRYMYDYVQRCGVMAAIDYPDGFTADPGHHWGVAPFHYAERVYRRQLDEMARIAATLTPEPDPVPQGGTDPGYRERTTDIAMNMDDSNSCVRSAKQYCFQFRLGTGSREKERKR
jgi:hypothetical protein